ncbi:MAG: glycosyl transferase putative gt9A [Pseudomonadota bacterium]|jgi:heptosyltransferase-2
MALPKKILIISAAWIGDMVISQALFKYIKQQYAETIIDIVAPRWGHELLASMPEINEIFDLPIGHGQFQLKKRWQLGRSFRKKNYQQAIILPNSWKSAIIPLVAGIPLRTGWLGEMRFGLLNDWRTLDKKKYPMMIQRFLALGAAKTIANKAIDWQLYKPYLTVNPKSLSSSLKNLPLIIKDKPLLILCPGAAFGPAKRWPAGYFAKIAHAKKTEGWQVFLLGAQSDEAIGHSIQKLTGNGCINLIGKTSLLQALNLLAKASLVISNDSGLMHLAAALHRPLIALYGSSSPEFTPPLSELAKVLYLKLSCSPCFERHCPLVHFNCLKQLKPNLVLATINDLIKT